MRERWRERPSFATFLAIGAFLLFSLSALPSTADHRRPIQPGARHKLAFDGWCTFNFVFTDDQGKLYIGTAAHCIQEVGHIISLPDIGPIGEVVYSEYQGNSAVGQRMDFALIEIFPMRYELVDPSVRLWGGPTAVQTVFQPGDLVLHHGQGQTINMTEPTRTRVGVLESVYGSSSTSNGASFAGWFASMSPIVGGDSGGPVLTSDGKALGIASSIGVAFGEPSILMGPTVELIVRHLRKAGLDLSLVTAPFNADDPSRLTAAVEETVWHCGETLVGDAWDDACLAPDVSDRFRRDPLDQTQPGQVNGRKERLGQGHIALGGPQTMSYTRATDGLDSFLLDAPPAGTIVTTETVDHGGIGYDIDIYFLDQFGQTVTTRACATARADESCAVPDIDRIRSIQVSAYKGMDLDVTVFAVHQDP